MLAKTGLAIVVNEDKNMASEKAKSAERDGPMK